MNRRPRWKRKRGEKRNEGSPNDTGLNGYPRTKKAHFWLAVEKGSIPLCEGINLCYEGVAYRDTPFCSQSSAQVLDEPGRPQRTPLPIRLAILPDIVARSHISLQIASLMAFSR